VNHQAKEKIIFETAFQQEHHFYPIKIEQFRDPITRNITSSDNLKLLYVADWSSPKSEWKKKLSELTSYDLDGVKLCFWIPSNYYEGEIFQKEIKNIVSNKNIEIFCMENIIPHINLLKFLSEFDIFVKVEGDFVNNYLKKLAQYLLLDFI
jgi:hypothetical protein